MHSSKILLYMTTLLLMAGHSALAVGGNLKPFRSDGCSAFPDGTYWQNELWLRCCYQHDLSYWQGGSKLQRLVADHDLEQCVKSIGEPTIARLMLAGVRVGGSPYWPTPFRWGYGWSYMRGYKPLSADERRQVKLMLQRSAPELLARQRENRDR
ncbi:hypothetical protein [Thiolapillus sp.]